MECYIKIAASFNGTGFASAVPLSSGRIVLNAYHIGPTKIAELVDKIYAGRDPYR